MTLTSSQLALLLEIRQNGSLARTALSLSVSPPAISQQLARLETEIGVPLVERGVRGARLTPLGDALADHGEKVAVELAAAAETTATFIGAHRNRLRIGAPSSLALTLLPGALASTRRRSPECELSVVEIKSDAGPGLVAAGEIDVALSARYTELPDNDLITLHHLADDPMTLVAPQGHHMVAGEAPVSLAELSDEDWVSGPPGRPSRVQLDDLAAVVGFIPRVPFTTESYDVAQALAEAGLAVGLIPNLALDDRFRTSVNPLTPPIDRGIFAVLPTSTDHIPLADDFLADLSTLHQRS